MEETNLNVLVDAKTEYTKQLVNILRNNIYLLIKDLFLEAKLSCMETGESHLVFRNFQNLLSKIPSWDKEKIKDETNKIIISSKCEWIDDLITAVFVSHTRILSSINVKKKNNKINLKIPELYDFIHNTFINSARNFWKVTYLFDDTLTNFQYQKNRKECESIIKESIEETIRKQLPVKNILNNYLDEKESNTTNNELKSLILNEIENCSNEQKLEDLNNFLKKNENQKLNDKTEEKTNENNIDDEEYKKTTKFKKSKSDSSINKISLGKKNEFNSIEEKSNEEEEVKPNEEEEVKPNEEEEVKLNEEEEVKLNEEEEVKPNEEEEVKPNEEKEVKPNEEEEVKLNEEEVKPNEEEEVKPNDEEEVKPNEEEVKPNEEKKHLETMKIEDLNIKKKIKNNISDNDSNKKVKITIQDLKNENEVTNNKVLINKLDSEKVLNIDDIIDEHLDIEKLNLDDMNNLSNLEEVYLDEEQFIPTEEYNDMKNTVNIKKKVNSNDYSFFS